MLIFQRKVTEWYASVLTAVAKMYLPNLNSVQLYDKEIPNYVNYYAHDAPGIIILEYEKWEVGKKTNDREEKFLKNISKTRMASSLHNIEL